MPRLYSQPLLIPLPANRWGRRRSLQIGIVSYILVVIAMAFTSSFPFLLILRILTGVTGQSMLIPAWSQGKIWIKKVSLPFFPLF